MIHDTKLKYFICHLLMYKYRALEFLCESHSQTVNQSIS